MPREFKNYKEKASMEYHYDCSLHKGSILIYFRFWFLYHSTDPDEPYKLWRQFL